MKLKNIIINSISIPLIIAFLSMINYSEGNNPEVSKQKPSLQSFTLIKYNSSGATLTIDGMDTEWKTNRTAVINKDTAFGFYKDENFLYVHVLTTDPEFSMQIMNFGLSIWFDPKGLQNKTVGVQFPVIKLQPPPPKEGGKPPRGDELKSFLKSRLKNIVIEFPEKRDMKQLTMAEANKYGIEAMIGVDEQKGAICYELKYPLNKPSAADQMGIDFDNIKYLDICIETPEINPSKLNEKDGKFQKAPDEGQLKDASERDIRPPKTAEQPKPPKPTIKPPAARVSQWIRVLF